MNFQLNAITLGVKDLARSNKFYSEGLGCTIDQDHPGFVSLKLGDLKLTESVEHRAPDQVSEFRLVLVRNPRPGLAYINLGLSSPGKVMRPDGAGPAYWPR